MNHREATIQAIRDLAGVCSVARSFRGPDVAHLLVTIIGYLDAIPDPVEPDIRPASELTAERLEAWTGGWLLRLERRFSPLPDARVFTGWKVVYNLRFFDGEMSYTDDEQPEGVCHLGSSTMIIGAGPLHSGHEWCFAPWSNVDAAVKAKGESANEERVTSAPVLQAAETGTGEGIGVTASVNPVQSE